MTDDIRLDSQGYPEVTGDEPAPPVLDPEIPRSAVPDTEEEVDPEELALFEQITGDSYDKGPDYDADPLEALLEQKEEPEASKEPEPLTDEQIAERTKALAALHRASLSMEDFADEAKAIEKGLALAESQKKTDDKLGELRGKLRDKAPVDPGQPAVAPGQTDGPTLEAVLSEEFGEEAAKKLAPLLQPKEPKPAEDMTPILAKLTGWMQDMTVRDMRASDDRITDANWPAVKKAFDQVAQSPAFEGVNGLEAAFKIASNAVLGAPPTPEQAQAKAARDKAKANGKLTTPNRQTPKKGRTAQEDEFLAFQRAFDVSKAAQEAAYGQQVT